MLQNKVTRLSASTFCSGNRQWATVAPGHRYMPDFHTLHGLLGQSSSGGPLPGEAGGLDGSTDGDFPPTGQFFAGRSISIGGESGELL